MKVRTRRPVRVLTGSQFLRQVLKNKLRCSRLQSCDVTNRNVVLDSLYYTPSGMALLILWAMLRITTSLVSFQYSPLEKNFNHLAPPRSTAYPNAKRDRGSIHRQSSLVKVFSHKKSWTKMIHSNSKDQERSLSYPSTF